MSNIYPESPPRPNSTLFLKRPIILVRIYNQTIPGDYYLTSRIYLVNDKNIYTVLELWLIFVPGVHSLGKQFLVIHPGRLAAGTYTSPI